MGQNNPVYTVIFPLITNAMKMTEKPQSHLWHYNARQYYSLLHCIFLRTLIHQLKVTQEIHKQ